MAVIEQIPLTRMDNADPELMQELLATVERVAKSAAFTGGAEVDAFEEEFADYCGTRYAVGVSSGTEALALALAALGLGPGDEVIVPANSFIATAEAVSRVGATPRFADVDGRSGLLTVDGIRAALDERTRCVIPVHLYGRTVHMEPILALARERGLVVVEDACQAHGAQLYGQRAGSLGAAGCFSFYPAKNLGAWGDGGAVVTNHDSLADLVRLMRSHGERPRYDHQMIGTTARLDALQAAILRVKLRRLERWNAGRRRAGAVLAAALDGAPVTPPLAAAPGGDHVFHQFVVETDDRDALRDHLAAQGIATGVHYPIPIHRTRAYESAELPVSALPVAEERARRICSLPMHPAMDDAEIARVAAAVRSFRA